MSESATTSQHDGRALREKAQAAKSAVVDLASEAKGYAVDRFGDLRSSAQEKVKDTNENVMDYIQRKPYQSIAIAAGVGFIVGMILKRR